MSERLERKLELEDVEMLKTCTKDQKRNNVPKWYTDHIAVSRLRRRHDPTQRKAAK